MRIAFIIAVILLSFREDVRARNTQAYDLEILRRYGPTELEKSRRMPGQFLAREWLHFVTSLISPDGSGR
jgi:hypothetical protein